MLTIMLVCVLVNAHEYVVLTQNNPNATVSSGESVTIYGTSDANQVTVESGADVELVNFPGSNTVSIESNSEGFTVSRSGSVVTFEGEDGTVVKIPATETSQTISFTDCSRTLAIASDQVMLSDQVVSTISSTIEYVVPPDTDTNFYVSPDGSDLASGSIDAPWATFEFAVRQLSPGSTLYVRGGEYHQRLIPRISGEEGNPITITAYQDETAVIDGETIEESGWWHGLIHLDSIKYVNVRGVTVKNSKGQAIHVSNCAQVNIEQNTTHTSVSSGILAWDSEDVEILNNIVIKACTGGGGYQECISVSTTTGFRIQGNTVHDGRQEGIDAKDGCKHGTVSGNTVYDQEQLGIYIDAWDSLTEDIDVFDNVVYNCSDGIRISSENGGRAQKIRVYNNEAHHNEGCGYWIGCGGEVAESHPVSDVILNANIARDNGYDGIRVSVPVNGSTDNIKITNNLVYGNGRAGIMIDDYSEGSGTIGRIDVINNTINENGKKPVDDDWGAGGIMVGSSSNDQVITLRNNIVSNNLDFSISVSPNATDTVIVDHNLIFGFRSELNETRGTDFVDGDPLFKDQENFDFNISINPISPAVDAGTTSEAPEKDFSGSSRPIGSGIDIGAYEAF
jgi:hypothetical protein